MPCVSVSQSQQMKISKTHEVSIKKIRWILQWKAKRKRLNSSDVVLAFLEVISQQGSTKQAEQIQ